MLDQVQKEERARSNGVDGPLRWRDLQIGGAAMRPGATPDDTVEFIVSVDDPAN